MGHVTNMACEHRGRKRDSTPTCTPVKSMASFTFILSEAIHLKWYRPTILRLWLELGLVGLGLGFRLVGLGLVGLDFKISRVRVRIEFRVIVLELVDPRDSGP